MDQLIFLGTGSAMTTRSFNSCFVLRTDRLTLLVDAGGGNGVLRALEQASVPVEQIHHFFVTHTHTDHVLGAVWVVRMAVYHTLTGSYSGKLHVYGNSTVLSTIHTLCRLTFLESYYTKMASVVEWVEVGRPGVGPDTLEGHPVRFFCVGSTGVEQTGFRIILSPGRDLTFLGDESLTEANMDQCLGTRWLVCGAFCRWADRDVFQPYRKHHHTVLDVARLAARAGVSHLVLVHCEDTDLPRRQALYAAEAATAFSGPVTVPLDRQVLPLAD